MRGRKTTMYCIKCGKEIRESSKFCPYCGADQAGVSTATPLTDNGSPGKSRRSGTVLIGTILVLAVLILAGVIFYTVKGKNLWDTENNSSMETLIPLIEDTDEEKASLNAAGREDAGGTGSGEGRRSDIPFKIGMIGPMSGDGATYGITAVRGAEMAVSEINETGGINGCPVEFNYEDDELNTDKAIHAYYFLRDWGMQIMTGAITSGCTIALAESTYDDGVFLLTPTGTAKECFYYSNAFGISSLNAQQGEEAARFIATSGIGHTCVVLYDETDAYSEELCDGFVKEAGNQGIEIVIVESISNGSQQILNRLIQARDSDTDFLFMPVYYPDAADIIEMSESIGYHPQYFGCDGLDGILTSSKLTREQVDGMLIMHPFLVATVGTSEMTQRFIDNYQRQYGEDPTFCAAAAYDAIYAIKMGIEEAEVTSEMETVTICNALEDAFQRIGYAGITSSHITWDASGRPRREPNVYEIINGEYHLR